MEKIIELKNITTGYENKVVLRNVSLSIYEKDFLGVIGPNGGGKTTLIKTILGLLSPTEGDILFYDKGTVIPPFKMGYMPQVNNIDRKFPISVKEVVASGLMSEKPRFKSFTKEQLNRIDQVIAQMGLEELKERPIGKLSGGQIQRVLLSRSMVSQPRVLILDEPNSYVDKRFESKFYKLLEEINKETAIILVSHDIGTVLSMVKNIVCVNETLHYHPGADVSIEWMQDKYDCPIEMLGHGNFPHRILKNHQ